MEMHLEKRMRLIPLHQKRNNTFLADEPTPWAWLLLGILVLLMIPASSIASETQGEAVDTGPGVTAPTLEYRPAGTHFFSPVSSGTVFAEGTMLTLPRRVEDSGMDFVDVLLGKNVLLSVFPGAAMIVGFSEIKLLAGRIRVVVPETGRNLLIRLGNTLMEVTDGEAWAESTPQEESYFALRRGFAWVKTAQSKIFRLSPGKQLFLRPGVLTEQLQEIDNRWKFSRDQIVLPSRQEKPSEAWRTASDTYDETDPASESDEIEPDKSGKNAGVLLPPPLRGVLSMIAPLPFEFLNRQELLGSSTPIDGITPTLPLPKWGKVPDLSEYFGSKTASHEIKIPEVSRALIQGLASQPMLASKTLGLGLGLFLPNKKTPPEKDQKESLKP